MNYRTMSIVAVLSALMLISAGCLDENKSPQGGWVKLSDSETLEGWKTIGGQGKFYFEDGVIVSETVAKTASTFLCTEKEYGDFILELEFKVDPSLNSGVQIRSSVHEKDYTTDYVNGKMEQMKMTFKAGTIFGYQVEIDPSERSWTGGFYEEGGRGWIKNLADNEPARKAFKQNQWNRLKIQAIGNEFVSWVNGVKAVETTDNARAKGFIGLQLHAIYKASDAGKKVCWRNIRIMELNVN